ncbi:hypothetical protein QFZ75_003572 [Streptomyces sp. V3I8]|uniref:hypothetical protein n=1 Tax=Streptomyces sp. V3I8 TaxID=3042279 RepID=UPI00277E6C11|nr:hypothetical protein [Streptomyces sp. V3I8]MDQ1037156.1 hypothetical protein [Streptomyces sp. V3I8]
MPAVRGRRQGRTALLIATAAVLGLVAGTCAGYLVQADRGPTALPSLSQPVVAQAEGAGPEPLSAAQDPKVRADGDLRKLLVERPKGARDSAFATDEEGDWMSLAEYSSNFTEPDEAFDSLVGDEFRRAAVTAWREGSTYEVEIRLVQYRQEEVTGAGKRAESAYGWAEEQSSTRSRPVPGTGDGMAYVRTEPDQEPGYLPMYSAEAHAWRGDIAMEIWVYDTKPIPEKKIMDLAERQMRRL